MALDVVALALLTAALWGSSMPVSKLGMEHGGSPFQAALTVVTVSVVAYWAAMLIAGRSVLAHSPFALGLFALTGVLATAVARVVSFNGVERVGASINAAGVNTRPVFASIAAVVFLGEVLTLQTALGIVIVVAGLIALALSEGGDIRGWRYRDLAFPLGAAVVFAAGNVLRRYGLTVTDMTALEAVAVNETAGLVGLLLFIVVFRSNDLRGFLSAPRRAYGYFCVSGVLSAVALFTLFEALDRGRVVVVDPLSNPTSLFALLFTAILLREVEEVNRLLVFGVVLVVTGVVVISAPEVLAA